MHFGKKLPENSKYEKIYPEILEDSDCRGIIFNVPMKFGRLLLDFPNEQELKSVLQSVKHFRPLWRLHHVLKRVIQFAFKVSILKII